MSSRELTYTSSSSASTGMPSKVILLIGVILSIVWGALDINYHGHFNCNTLVKVVNAELAKRTHLSDYMADQKDEAGQLETGTVRCECAGRKIVLTGKVVNDNIRQEFSDVAAMAVGADRIDNQIETLNEGALKELQALLETPPTKVTMNYQVKKRGTLYLTGDIPNQEIKDHIGALVAKIRGVRSVVNDLGKEATAQRMLRIHNIYFDFNQFKIRDQSQVVIDEVANKVEEFLASNPKGWVRIEGHTDSIAGDQYNKWLSEKRAQAVLEALVSRGIPADKLKAVGLGKTRLLVPHDDTPEKRAENRRIEFYFE